MLSREEILQEVSEYAPKKLRELEKTFALLKKSTNNKTARLTLIRQIKELTKIPEVVLFIDRNYNAGVIPIYKMATMEDILKSTLALFSEKPAGEKIPKNQLRKLETIAESPKMISRIYLSIGAPLIRDLTPSELVAVLLHEFGHVYAITSSIPETILSFLDKVFSVTIFSNFLLTPLKLNFIMLSSQLMMLYIIATLLFSHGVSFLNRIGEYKADNYVLKYGYADELISVINKFSNLGISVKKKSSFSDFLTKIIKNIFLFFLRLISPANFVHPTDNKRIKNLENQIFNEYRSYYPDYKDVLNLVQADYAKQGV